MHCIHLQWRFWGFRGPDNFVSFIVSLAQDEAAKFNFFAATGTAPDMKKNRRVNGTFYVGSCGFSSVSVI